MDRQFNVHRIVLTAFLLIVAAFSLFSIIGCAELHPYVDKVNDYFDFEFGKTNNLASQGITTTEIKVMESKPN